MLRRLVRSIVAPTVCRLIGASALLWAEARFHAAIGSYHRVDKFITPSRFMRDAIARRFGQDRVIHIPNGIDVSRVTPSFGTTVVLYFGRLSPEKGIITLLETHASDNGAWPLMIAGTGPMLEDLRRRFPLAEFKGYLTGKALEAFISRASVVVVPSEWNENSPISVLEAMAHGKPVVASRIGGIPEFVTHGETGLLFEPKERSGLSRCLTTLLGDAELRKRLGNRARTVVEAEFSLEKHGKALLSLYESAIASRPRNEAQGLLRCPRFIYI